MTLDQIYARLCEIEMLKTEPGKRTETVDVAAAQGTIKADMDGMVCGRAADGTPIRGRIRGKSLARELMERENRKEKKRRRHGT